MRVLIALITIFFAGIISSAALARAEATGQTGALYQWEDDQGNVHITDRQGDVPEKYRSRATVMQNSSTQQNTNETPQPQAAPQPSGDGNSSQNDKAQWQQRIKDWKNRLADAQSRYQNLQQQRNDLFAAWGSPAMAPLANRQQADQIDQQMQEVQQEIVKARNMIDNVIPEEARKAGVPPGWLRE